MGTRADFYVGKGENARWLGSIAWDGDPTGAPADVLKAHDEEEYILLVKKLIREVQGTTPEMGWPWPWEDSQISDYAYTWDDGTAWITHHMRGADLRKGWHTIAEEKAQEALYKAHGILWEQWSKRGRKGDEPKEPKELWHGDESRAAVFPNMKNVQNVTLGPRSGLLVFKG